MTTPMSAMANGSSPNSLSGSQATVMSLTQKDDATKVVIFDFHPEEISLNHSSAVQPVAAGKKQDDRTLTSNHPVRQDSPLNIGIQGLVLVGSGVADNCEQLLQWTYAATQMGQTQHAELPTLTFSWGKLKFPVTLTRADVKYQRFAVGGAPIRAKVGLTMHRLDHPPAPTNPSSGGLPGRRSHMVVAGENLQQIATSAYGRPAAWRAIALANSIEDPLRVRPGAVVYLPSAEELATGSQP